jgi:putative ABC transport system permease protein
MVAVINRNMAAKYFARQNPIGRKLLLVALKAAPEPIADPWFEIVGVVSDIKNEGARRPVAPEAYLPYTVAGYGSYNVFVRTVGNPATLSTALERQVLGLDRSIIPQQTITMDEVMEIREYAKPRFGLILLSIFAGMGLTLVSVGVYRVMSYTVTQQRQEIGIRMALGANASDVRWLVMTAGLRFIFMGVGTGLLLTLLAGRILASEVWGVSWYDPLTLAGVVLVLIVVGLTAAYPPSIRATRVDPAISLRYE